MQRTRCYFTVPVITQAPDDGIRRGYDGGHVQVALFDKPGVMHLEGFGAFCQGFWISSRMELVSFDDLTARWWVPPHKVQIIERVHVQDEEDSDAEQ
ncbi:MAG: hypothetical protein ACR2PR_07470 [Pseudohongiellaceae bacterium]